MRLQTEFLVFIFLILKSSPLTMTDLLNEWVIWNVGQGQWITHIQNDHCRHYDVGGELGTFKDAKKSLQRLCLQRENQVAISHWDFDHYSQLFLLAKTVPRICWLSKPKWIDNKKSVRAIRDFKFPDCRHHPSQKRAKQQPQSRPQRQSYSQRQSQPYLQPKSQSNLQVQKWRPQKYRSLNGSSEVFVDQDFLLPGDSPQIQEKLWIKELQGLSQIRVLILGHHGSRTSTSKALLQALPQIKMAISSARYARYRHPHHLILKRLTQFHTPVLRTEDWGHLHIK